VPVPRREKGTGRGRGRGPDIEALLDDLYTTPPPRFVARRAELAAEVTEAGDADDARRISGARRPTLSAWAANLLALSRRQESRQFLELGQALREAHETLDRAQLKELSGQQWRVIAALSAQAAQLAGEAGHRLSESAQHEVESTLRAVLADPEAADQWVTGRLERALTPPSTLPGAAATSRSASAPGTAARTKGGAKRQPTGSPSAPARDDLAERRRAREERLAHARDEAKAAEQELRGQRKKLSSAETVLDRSRTRRERAQQQVEAAEQRLRKARADLDRTDQDLHDAEEQHRAAADALKQAERAARDATREVERLSGPRRKS
jgi:hypothetical protein